VKLAAPLVFQTSLVFVLILPAIGAMNAGCCVAKTHSLSACALHAALSLFNLFSSANGTHTHKNKQTNKETNKKPFLWHLLFFLVVDLEKSGEQ